ncbi:MAG: tetratricopeptide repeat-containing glycosyltransferase family 2 protein [Syntrophales bacterium]
MNKKVVRKTKKKPTISLCMIVKNEEAFLAQCLESVKDCVDEIIIVDTGSTDRTVEIAESYGAGIYHHPWENDYSKHRNQSLSYATGDWIFILDADEELFAEDNHKVRHAVRDNKVDYYHCQFHDIMKDGSVKGIFNLVRLFRNNRGMNFTQKVHEQLQIRGKGAFSAVRLRHYGYDLSPEKMNAKHIRTITLLKEMLETPPAEVYTEAYLLHQLASSYSMHREPDKAVEYGEMALEVISRKKLRYDFCVTTFSMVARGYCALGKFEDAERICIKALDYFPMNMDVCHILAAIYWDRKSFEQCRTISERYLDIHEAYTKNPSLMGGFYCKSIVKRHEIFNCLGKLHFVAKEWEKAEEFFIKAFEDSGRRMAWAEIICRFYLEEQTEEKFLRWLTMAYEAGMRENIVPAILQVQNKLYLKIGQIFLQKNNPDAAYDCLQKADDEYLSGNEKIAKRLHLASLGWMKDETDEMIGHLENLLSLLQMNTERRLNSIEDLGEIVYDIAEVFCGRGQWPLAEPALQLAIQIAPEMFDHGRFDRLLPGNASAGNNSA